MLVGGLTVNQMYVSSSLTLEAIFMTVLKCEYSIGYSKTMRP